jgi:hypothetical protein
MKLEHVASMAFAVAGLEAFTYLAPTARMKGTVNDSWRRKPRGADLHRDQHHLRDRHTPSDQCSLVGIARDLRGLVVGRPRALGSSLRASVDQPAIH